MGHLSTKQRAGLAYARTLRARWLARLNRALVAILVVTRINRDGHTYPDLHLCGCPRGDLNPLPDCPWRPADLAQREGRILRQCNLNSEVEILR